MGIPSAQSTRSNKTTSGAGAGARAVVESLYASLARGDAAAATALLAADVDWWFHGPRRCQQHMRRLLTGELSSATATAAFRFTPARVADVGEGWVLAEGWAAGAGEEGEKDYWVHAWRVRGGVISGFREYFNTCVTVRELGRRPGPVKEEGDVLWAVWESQNPWPKAQRCMPGLVLAI